MICICVNDFPKEIASSDIFASYMQSNPASLKGAVIIGNNALSDFQKAIDTKRKIFFLADFRTMRKCLPLVESHLNENVESHTLVIQEGERFKNINTCILLWKQLQSLNAGRNDLFVNVGGGVVCDIGGFIAATFKRGMAFINIPTSLMAMTDAGLGGKTGVDIDFIKNQIGVFAEPEAIYIYPPFLHTLDQRQYINGYAEVVKHALIADKNFWNEIITTKPDTISGAFLEKSISIKNAVTKEDFTESGKRKVLNFGHTFGHAFETFSLKHDKHPLLHGEAVAMGIVCESYLSTQKTGLSNEALKSIKDYIFRYFDKYNLPLTAIDELLDYIKQDKKNDVNGISLSLLAEIGNCSYNIYCSEEEIVTAFNVYHDLKN
jgi:3-dehydroquinate synthase